MALELGKCMLCGEEKELLNKSHIFPEFLYKPLYDDQHTFFEIQYKDHQIKNRKPKFKGVHEKGILCEKCDNVIIGQNESYSRNALFEFEKIKAGSRPTKEVVKNSDGSYCSIIRKIDYSKFKLFIISMVWRASISKNEYFKDFNIGAHQDIMRSMILNNDPGEELAYASIYFTLESTDQPTDFIAPPRIGDWLQSPYRAALFMLGPFVFTIFLSSQISDQLFLKSTIKKSGEMMIYHIPEGEGLDFIKRFAL